MSVPFLMRVRAASRVLLFAAAFVAASARSSNEAPDHEFLRVPSSAADASRPVPKFQYMFGAPARWSGPLRWKYNPANAPAPFDADPAATAAMVRAALDSWTSVCGITHVYDGETATPPNQRIPHQQFGEQPDFQNVVGWRTLGGDTTGIAYVWYDELPGGRTLADADIILSPDRVRSSTEMRRTGSHEWGHSLGLAHSDVAGALMSGPPDTAYNSLVRLQSDDIRGCRCLYGPAAGQQAGYACSPPTRIDFGTIPVGGSSAPRTATLKNDGNGPLTVAGVFITSLRVSKSGGCPAGIVLSPGESCAVQLVAHPDFVFQYNEFLTFETSDGPYRVAIDFNGSSSEAAAPPVVTLIEYRHGGFGHYFMTHLIDEIVKLDGGTFIGWARTGRTINAWKDDTGVSTPVCRFFSAAFAPKSSHFYTPFASECRTVKGDSTWSFEGEVFHAALPDAQGNCAVGMQPVFRLHNAGQSGAPNHRFTTDALLRQQMIGQGWVAEGAGQGVGMCAPL